MRRKAPSNREAWGRPCNKKRFSHPVFGNGNCTQFIYYQYLEAGFRLPPSAGSASGVHLNPLGYDRVYVHTGRFDGDAWWQGLGAGRSFVTNGPLLDVRVNQQLPGHTFRVAAGEKLPLTVDAQVASVEPLSSVEVVSNGAVVATAKPDSEALPRLKPSERTHGGPFGDAPSC